MLDTTIYVFIPLLCGIISATCAALTPRPLTRKQRPRQTTSPALDHAQHPEDKLASRQAQPSPAQQKRTNSLLQHRHHARLKKQTTSYAKKPNTTRICPPQSLPLTRKDTEDSQAKERWDQLERDLVHQNQKTRPHANPAENQQRMSPNGLPTETIATIGDGRTTPEETIITTSLRMDMCSPIPTTRPTPTT